jgi:hypothetical protein
MAFITLLAASALTSVASASLVTCPEMRFQFDPRNANWATLTISDVTMALTGLGNNTFHRIVNFNLASSLDGSKVPCSGEHTHDNNDPNNEYPEILIGKCEVTSGLLGDITTEFTHIFARDKAESRFNVHFGSFIQCQNSTQQRPYALISAVK